ncbi:MAG: S1 RNA-binding domain-containing protein, partial [Clostridiales bacterium]|nr:S1 RNA-binding domain-containing protein [Candidatus Equinaster intestinalis]
LKVGQEVEAKIIAVDGDRKRVSLSIRALLPEEPKAEKAEAAEPVAEEAPAVEEAAPAEVEAPAVEAPAEEAAE